MMKKTLSYIAILLMVLASSSMIPFHDNETNANPKNDICGVWEPLIEDCMTIIKLNCFCEIVVE